MYITIAIKRARIGNSIEFGEKLQNGSKVVRCA